ncbi:uncharacterized protein LOC134255201 [Saccostrea cucullata]|uniref:uncharacterized protein LOC134255201 n=1 Tax=Saccostrea cuccullata TaxID=36930 RepID=UPI002ED0E9CB
MLFLKCYKHVNREGKRQNTLQNTFIKLFRSFSTNEIFTRCKHKHVFSRERQQTTRTLPKIRWRGTYLVNMSSVRYSHQIISTMLEEVLEKCCNEVHTDKIIQNDSNSHENVSSEVCHIMNELLDSLDDVDESAKTISTEPSNQRESIQDQQSGLTGVMNLSIDEENAEDVYEVMDLLLLKCCEIADKNNTSDYIFRENSTNVSKFLQGSGNPNYGAYLNDNNWNYVCLPDVLEENLTDDKIREKNMSENWEFKNKPLNQEGNIMENHAVENMLVNHDSGEKLKFEQGLNEVDAGTRDVCFNVNDVNLVPHNLPSLRCLCEQVLLGPTADSQGIESLKSLALKFIEGHGMNHCYEKGKQIDTSPLKMKDKIRLLKDHCHEERFLNCKQNENVSSEIPVIENPSKCETTSSKMVQGYEDCDFELESKDNERNDCDGKMKFINYLGLSPSMTLENETDTENFCSKADQNAHESLLQPAVTETKSKNYTLNCTEMKQTKMREQDKVFELDLADSQCMSLKTEAKDIKCLIKLSETKMSDNMKQDTLLIKSDVQNGFPLDMEQLIPCKRIKLEDEELSIFQNHHTDEKQCETHLLARINSDDDSEEDPNENTLDATVDIDMKKEKQNLDDTAKKNIEIIQDNLSVGQLESLVPLNFYQEKQSKEEASEVERKVSELDENHGNANLSKTLVSNNIPDLEAKDEDKCTYREVEGYVFEEMQKTVKSTEQMVPSTMNKEPTETYDGESFYDDENHRCDKYRNVGAKETSLQNERKDSVHGVFEPNTKCFKWKYTPSYDDDMDAVVPDTEKESHDLPCRILPILSCKKPIRLGLSRKQHHLASLHPYMKKEKK